MQKKNRIGIITIYGENNFGNRLQNYAVHRVLTDLGNKCQTIAHQMPLSPKDKLKTLIKTWIFTIFPLVLQKKRPEDFREFKFKKFTKQYIPTKHYYTNALHLSKDIANEYDYFVIGSDQVWNPTFGNYGKIIDDMFLKFAKPNQKICFAPSFGIDEIPSEWKGVIKENLNTLSNISVREESGAKIVKELIGKEAEVLIDPTMMLSKEEWLTIAKPTKVDTLKPYMLQYFLGNQNVKHENELERISNQHNLVIYKLLDLTMPELYDAAPDEFIDLISKSTLICTDSFHAVVFSILFGKPFIVFKRNDNNVDMSSRIDTLFRKFNLKSRYYHEIGDADIFFCDYSQCYLSLVSERKKVIDFLSNSINKKKEKE